MIREEEEEEEEKEEKEKTHTELRNSRTGHHVVQSYSHASRHLFVVVLFTVRDKNKH